MKLPECGADQRPPARVWLRVCWGYTTASPVCLHRRYGVTFTFTLPYIMPWICKWLVEDRYARWHFLGFNTITCLYLPIKRARRSHIATILHSPYANCSVVR